MTRGKPKQGRVLSTRGALILSAVLALLGGLLSDVVASLIRVPAGWEWVPVAALIVVFLASLPVTLALARESQKAAQERGVTIEQVELNRSEMRDIHGEQVTVKGAKLTDSKISDIEAR